VGSAAVLKGEAASVVRHGSGVLRGAAPAACGATSPATCGLLWSPPRGRSGGGMGEVDDLGGVWRGRKQDEGRAESSEQPVGWRTRLTAGLELSVRRCDFSRDSRPKRRDDRLMVGFMFGPVVR
jgi:hypothetical protein